MPAYSWICDDGHITRKIGTTQEATDTITCHCGKTAEWFLEGQAPGIGDPNRIWLGSEVHGKRYGGDEWRADMEKAAAPRERVSKDVAEAYEKTRAGVNR